MREYRASGKVGILGIPMMLIFGLLAGLIIGGIAFVISFQFNLFLICVFPLIMGVVGGAFMIGAVKIGKVRNPLIAGLFGLLTGIAIIAVFRGGEYYFTYIHDDAMRRAARQLDDATDQEIILQSIPIGLQEINLEDFVEFNQLLAELGTVISYRSSEIELNEQMTWILWAVEGLSILLICIGMPFSSAGDPFDETNNRWFGNWEWFASVPWNKKQEFLDLLKRGDFKGAGALMTTGTLSLPRIDIELTGDPSDGQSDWLLKISEIKPARKDSNSSLVKIGLVSPIELSALRSNVASGGQANTFGR